MAWLELDKRSGHFKVGFRIGERKFKKSLETSEYSEAVSAKGTVEQTLRALVSRESVAMLCKAQDTRNAAVVEAHQWSLQFVTEAACLGDAVRIKTSNGSWLKTISNGVKARRLANEQERERDG